MKLCRYGAPGNERPALIDPQGRLRDLSGHIDDIGPESISPETLQSLAGLSTADLPLVTGTPRLGPPLRGVSKFIGIGLNYRDHAREAGLPLPAEPIIFLKAPSCISGPYDPIRKPAHSTRLDWELELGVVIGSTARQVTEQHALQHVAGYCIVNDVSDRGFQFQSSQWDKGKGCDSFGPIGPWLVTRDEIADPQRLNMWLEINGVRRQAGNTADMIFSVAQIVAYCSCYMTLLPGDIISTGTPAGVGMGQQPEPVWLANGDQTRLWIEGLGEQSQRVVSD